MVNHDRFRDFWRGEAPPVEDKDHDDNDNSIEQFQDVFVDVYKALRPYPDALRAVERTLAERLHLQEKDSQA